MVKRIGLLIGTFAGAVGLLVVFLHWASPAAGAG